MKEKLEKLYNENSFYEFGDQATDYKEYIMSLLIRAYNLGKKNKI